MNHRDVSDRLATHSHRFAALLCCLLILVVALRRRYDLVGNYSFEYILILLVLFTLLFATEPLISRRIRSYYRIYFIVQLIIVQLVGISREYQDTWALLYIVLGFQVAPRCSRREALVWYSLFAVALLSTLLVEFGLISGLGRALAYIVIGVLVISYDIQYSQHEDALAESQVLVEELSEANQKLKDYADQAEELAAIQERNRMVQELYDSVGQKVFAIQLAAETARILLTKESDRAIAQIDDLQGQTQTALTQMRQLIEQWRPD